MRSHTPSVHLPSWHGEGIQQTCVFLRSQAVEADGESEVEAGQEGRLPGTAVL